MVVLLDSHMASILGIVVALVVLLEKYIALLSLMSLEFVITTPLYNLYGNLHGLLCVLGWIPKLT